MFDKVPLIFQDDDVITVTWHILSNLIMMLLKIGQQKKFSKFETRENN